MNVLNWATRWENVPSDIYIQWTQINLHFDTVLSESSFSEWRIFAFLAIQYVPKEDSDQSARTNLILRWVHLSEGSFSKGTAQLVMIRWDQAYCCLKLFYIYYTRTLTEDPILFKTTLICTPVY